MPQKKKTVKRIPPQKKSPSELLMDEIEPIWVAHERISNMIDEGGPVHPGPVHPTQHDESDDIEEAKSFYSWDDDDEQLMGQTKSDYFEPARKRITNMKEKVLGGPDKKPKIRKSATAEQKLNFLGEWLAQEHLMIELAYDPLKEHHPTRNNKLGPCDGKDPNGREVEIRTQKRNKTNFVIPKRSIERCQTVERLVFVEYDDTNTIGIWECTDRSVNEKNKTFALPIKHMQLLLSFDNADYAEQMRAVK
jgi:hypothetical protein